MKLALGGLRTPATMLLALAVAGCPAGHALESVAPVPGHVAASTHVQQWSQTLWGLVTSHTGTETPSFGDPVMNPDGSVTQTFTTADGTEVVLASFPDGSALLDITCADGSTQSVSQSIPRFDGVSITTIDWRVTSSDGLSVEYTSTVDDRGTIFDMSDDITQLLGSSVLPGGVTQQFDVLTADGLTEVLSTQSDGSTFTLSVPLMAPDFARPDLSQGASGTYTGPGFSVDFTLTPTPKYPTRWAALVTDLGGAMTGTCSLNGDFSGFGQLTESSPQDETLVALLSWTQDGETHVYLLSGQDRSMGPAGAALDYLEHRWQTLTALLAPAPVGSADAFPPPFFSDVPSNHWAFLDVYKTANAGIVSGYPEGSYHPDEAVNRAQMAVYISRALAGGDENMPGSEAYLEPSFDDVAADYWAYRYIEYALGADVVRGYDDGRYRPEDDVDRGQMAVYVARAKGWVGVDDDMSTAPELFPDVPAGFWSGVAVQTCVDNGVVHGYADGYYHPQNLVTRDQMAVYVARAFELLM